MIVWIGRVHVIGRPMRAEPRTCSAPEKDKMLELGRNLGDDHT